MPKEGLGSSADASLRVVMDWLGGGDRDALYDAGADAVLRGRAALSRLMGSQAVRVVCPRVTG